MEHRLTRSDRFIHYQLIIAGLLFNAFVATQLLAVIANIQQLPVKEAAIVARQFNQKPVMWRLNTPSFSVYSYHLVERRSPRAGDLVFTKARHLAELGTHKLLYQRNGFALAKLAP